MSKLEAYIEVVNEKRKVALTFEYCTNPEEKLLFSEEKDFQSFVEYMKANDLHNMLNILKENGLDYQGNPISTSTTDFKFENLVTETDGFTYPEGDFEWACDEGKLLIDQLTDCADEMINSLVCEEIATDCLVIGA